MLLLSRVIPVGISGGSSSSNISSSSELASPNSATTALWKLWVVAWKPEMGSVVRLQSEVVLDLQPALLIWSSRWRRQMTITDKLHAISHMNDASFNLGNEETYLFCIGIKINDVEGYFSKLEGEYSRHQHLTHSQSLGSLMNTKQFSWIRDNDSTIVMIKPARVIVSTNLPEISVKLIDHRCWRLPISFETC